MDDATWSLVVLAIGWAIAAAGLGCLCYIAFASYRNNRKLARAWALHKKMQRREWLARLRHRDFDAFCIEVNNQRAERHETPIPAELLKKVQYNLMYTIEED